MDDGREQERLRVRSQVGSQTFVLLSRSIIEGLHPFTGRVKALTYDKGIKFAAHNQVDQAPKITRYFSRHFISWEYCSNETLMVCCVNICLKKSMNTVDEGEITMITTDWITDP
jgi:IS30 family transposase